MRKWITLSLFLALAVGVGATPRSVIFEEFGRYN
jgi:hypothetical protein